MTVTETFKGKELVVLFTCNDVYDIRSNEDRLPRGAIVSATYVRLLNGDVRGNVYVTSDYQLIDQLCADISDEIDGTEPLFVSISRALDVFRNETLVKELDKIAAMECEPAGLLGGEADNLLFTLSNVLREWEANPRFVSEYVVNLAHKIKDPVLVTLVVIAANNDALRPRAIEVLRERVRTGLSAGLSI